MNRLPIAAHLRVQDIVDILFLTVVAYHLYPSCGVQVQRQTNDQGDKSTGQGN